jgi:hypothetical protein
MMRSKWLALFLMLGAMVAAAQQTPPALFFSDLSAGPNSGGESVNGFSGAYVTLYGNFFGSTQGTSSVTWNGSSCLRVVSWGTTWLWFQKIVVQLGSSCAAGTGNFVVTVSGAASNGIPFTVNSGSIYFVSTSGNDSASGSFSSPWKTIPKAVQTAGAKPGSIIYLMNGVSQTADDGQSWNAAVTLRNEWCKGTSAQPDALLAYPGATVQIGPTSGSTPVNGLRSTDFTASSGACAGNWTIGGISFRGIGPVGLGGGTNWRFIGNDVSNPSATGGGGGGAAWETTLTTYVKAYGNYFHDLNLASTDRLEQGVYPSTDSNHTDLGWNEIYNSRGRAGLQIHSSPVDSNTGFIMYDILIHDNKIHGTAEEGIIVDTVDPSQGPVQVYNNVIYDTGRDGAGTAIYRAESSDFSTAHGIGSGTIEFYNNTIYCQAGEGCWGATFEVHNSQPVVDRVRNNLLYAVTGKPYWIPSVSNWALQGGSEFCQNNDTPSNCPNFTGANNLVFGNGAATFPNLLSGSLNTDPKLVSPGTDFHLQSGSPAIGAGVAIPGLTRDIDGRLRPNPPSIGAYEFGSGTTVVVQPPTALTATPH